MSNDTSWHESDAFWEAVGPVLFSSERRASAATEIESVLALSGTAPGP
jgi:hypothetical protein